MVPREPHPIDALLEDLPVTPAPEHLWDGIERDLRHPPAAAALPRRVGPPRLVAAAGILFALAAGATVGTLWNYRAPDHWDVLALAGVPSVGGAALGAGRALGAGEWLVTDSISVARLEVGRIGTADVGPNSRVRLDRGGRREHRLTLEHGSLEAIIDAPPRLFFVETPSAIATDLGCAYTIEVDSTGASWIHVTAGWVELRQGDQTSLVAAGLVAEVDIGGSPGTPYPNGMAPEARNALQRLDRGSNDIVDLEAVIAALYPHSLFVNARQPSTITLWHLIQRLDGDLRRRAYVELASVSTPPDEVTMEGILALDRPMLERWRRDLHPMWSEEDVPMLIRTARRLLAWMVR